MVKRELRQDTKLVINLTFAYNNKLLIDGRWVQDTVGWVVGERVRSFGIWRKLTLELKGLKLQLGGLLGALLLRFISGTFDIQRRLRTCLKDSRTHPTFFPASGIHRGRTICVTWCYRNPTTKRAEKDGWRKFHPKLSPHTAVFLKHIPKRSSIFPQVEQIQL